MYAERVFHNSVKENSDETEILKGNIRTLVPQAKLWGLLE